MGHICFGGVYYIIDILISYYIEQLEHTMFRDDFALLCNLTLNGVIYGANRQAYAFEGDIASCLR